MDLREIPLKKIKIKDRARIDLGDIEGLAAAIDEKGQLQPITVDQHFNLRAGERRFRAHELLEKETIWAVVRPGAGTLDALEIELMENACRKDLTWPEQARLEKRIFDLHREKDPGWSQRDQQGVRGDPQSSINRRLQLAEALELMPDLADHENQDDAWKEFKRFEEEVAVNVMAKKASQDESISQAPNWAKDHYQIGDAFEGMQRFLDTQPQSTGRLFHFAEVDPPYGVELHRRKGRNTNTRPMAEYQEWDDYPRLFRDTARLVYECLQPNAFAVFWYGMSWHSETLSILREVGFGVPDIPAIWAKGEVGQTASPDTTFGSCYEPFFVARKGQPKLARAGRGNVFTYPGIQRKTHPTEKPVYLLEEIIRVICFPGSSILVPFLGSGVTLRAAYKLGHTGMGWDLSQRHKDGFLRRVADDIAEFDAANADAVAEAG